MKKRNVMAGNVLTKSLLNRVDKASYQFGGFELIEVQKKTALNLDARSVVAIPKKYIKGDTNKFLRDFEKTMNAWYYTIVLHD